MIYCVEDDQGIRDLMIYALNESGFEAAGFADSASFFQALKERRPDLVMLDIMLPGEDGISILKRLRADAETAEIPVIMASAKGSEYDKVVGLDLGADDYLAKPFGMMEMVSRVKAVMRRSGVTKDQEILVIGSLEMNKGSHTVSVDGKRVNLTLKEYEMLRMFMESPGRVFARDRIFDKIWGSNYMGETRTVDVHIGTLRTKLGVCGEYIETVRGVGYKLEDRR